MKKASSNNDPTDFAELSPETVARLRKVAGLSDATINLNDPDAPETTDWAGAVRGRFYKPVKRLKSFRIDADVLAYFESRGAGYQSEVNRVLRAEMIRALRAGEATQ
jgi:uncharacterized protein (DUF4415 family)